MKRSSKNVPVKSDGNILKLNHEELRKYLGLPASTNELADKLLDVSDFEHKQEVMQHVLGNLLENEYGKDDIESTEQLNKYLQLLKEKNYPYLEKARKSINENMPEVAAGFDSSSYGSGSFSYGPSINNPLNKRQPIALGSQVWFGGMKSSNPYTKGILSHELGHANDHLVRSLKRALNSTDESTVKKAQEILDRIDSSELNNQIANIDLKTKNSLVSELTPFKALEYEKMLKNSADFPDKQKILDFISRYKNHVASDDLRAKSGVIGFNQRDIGTLFGTDPKNIPHIAGEDVKFSLSHADTDKAINEQMKHPIKQELLRSSDHFSRFKDVPDDLGSFEFRNIRRLLEGKKLRGIAPLLAKGAAVGAGGLASLAAEASDAEEEGSAPEEAAMQREATEAKFKKAIGKEAYEAGQKNLEQTPPMHLLNPYAKLREKLK